MTVAAFLLRLAAGLPRGPDLADTGYAINSDIARTWWSGHGLCVAEEYECALRLPLYPMLIAPLVGTGTAYPLLLIFQALIGASLAALTFGLAAELFNDRVALLAAVAVTLDPYAVVHSTALQDTVVIDSLVVLAVWLLLMAWRLADNRLVVAAGITAALLVLTSARIVPFVILMIGWVMLNPATTRLRSVVALTLPLIVMVGPWLVRNIYVVGGPVLTTEAGYSLWKGHNDLAMSVYPARSLDDIEDLLIARMTPDQRKRIDSSVPALVRDQEFARLAVAYVRAQPLESLRAAVVRIAYGFLGSLSPYRSWLVQAAYAAVFMPVTVLAIFGLWRAGASGPHQLVVMTFGSLVITSAAFWAYTSHRSYLHAFEFVYAASVIERSLPWRWRRAHGGVC